MKPIISGLVFSLMIAVGSQAQSSQVELYYTMDQWAMTADHRDMIDTTLARLQDTGTYQVTIRGFTDFVGSSEYNLQLSRKRASGIASYLEGMEKLQIDSLYVVGLGEFDSVAIALPQIGVREHRKVQIEFRLLAVPTDSQHPDPDTEDISQAIAHDSLLSIRPVTGKRLQGLESLESDSLTVGSIIVLDDLNFYAGRHVLVRESIPRLKALLATLKENPNLHIRIEGHICCGIEGEPDGFDQDTGEQRLSYNRAYNIYQYLVRNGIHKSRLSFAGYGYSRPIYYPEKTPVEQQKNRRVEIIVTKI